VYPQKIGECDRQLDAPLQTFVECRDSQALLPVMRPRCDVRGALQRMTGIDLTAMEGSDEPPALTIISEIGLAMRRWPTVKHFTSWHGLCPHHQGSGGKV
jgi:transposase